MLDLVKEERTYTLRNEKSTLRREEATHRGEESTLRQEKSTHHGEESTHRGEESTLCQEESKHHGEEGGVHTPPGVDHTPRARTLEWVPFPSPRHEGEK